MKAGAVARTVRLGVIDERGAESARTASRAWVAGAAAVAVFAAFLLRGQDPSALLLRRLDAERKLRVAAEQRLFEERQRRAVATPEPPRQPAPARGEPILWQPGRYRLTLVKGSDLVSKYGEIGWSIPPGWMVRTSGPQACGSGALRRLFARGEWSFGNATEFVSGWQSYRLPFGLYATYVASGNFSAGAHVDTVQAGFYPQSSRFIRVVAESATRWRIGMDFWTDGRFDDLEMLLEKLDEPSQSCPQVKND